MRRLARLCLCLVQLFALANGASAAEPKRVLLLHSFGPQFVPWVFFSAQFREDLIARSPEKIDLYEVSLESARFQQPKDQGPFVDYVRSLFAGRKLDLIVTLGAPAAFFVQRFRPQFFPGTPMIIGGPEQRAINTSALTENDTTVAVTLNFAKWIENILQVLPDTNHIAWVVGASPLERFWTEEFRRTSQAFSQRLTFEWFNDLSFEDMLKRVAMLPPKSAIFYVDLRVDAAGVPLDRDRVLTRLHDAAKAPIFSYIDSYLGQGIVGGPLLSSSELGQRMASVALRILAGEHPGDITTPPLAMGAPAYDWRELVRWDISERRLPSGSQILFRRPGLWQQYRLPILAICAALLVEAAFIIWLAYERRRRHLAEVQSRNSMAELAYLNRRAAAGELSASIAHEVKQPLTGITTQASAALRWLRAEKPNIERARASLEKVLESGDRAADIVTSVCDLFKKSAPKKAVVDVNNLIRAVVAIVRVDLQAAGISLQTDLDERLATVEGDKVQLQQVILNLVMNSIDAMHAAESRLLNIKSELTRPNVVRVSIEDSGMGIDGANFERIFQPLFTTKAHGIGMGLSICRSIVENHDGKIWVTPGKDGGSAFQFELPTGAAPSPQPALQRPEFSAAPEPGGV